MPHINVLDLAVFPCISRRHTALARKRGGLHVLSEDEVWEAAVEVWDNLPNCKIAHGYVLSYRIAQKVIDNKGDNTFLGEEKGISCGVREDFHDTLCGVRRKDGRVIPAPPVVALPAITPF